MPKDWVDENVKRRSFAYSRLGRERGTRGTLSADCLAGTAAPRGPSASGGTPDPQSTCWRRPPSVCGWWLCWGRLCGLEVPAPWARTAGRRGVLRTWARESAVGAPHLAGLADSPRRCSVGSLSENLISEGVSTCARLPTVQEREPGRPRRGAGCRGKRCPKLRLKGKAGVCCSGEGTGRVLGQQVGGSVLSPAQRCTS